MPELTTKQIIEKAQKYLIDYLGKRIETGEILLEEVKPKPDNSWEITFSFFEKIKRGESDFLIKTALHGTKNSFKKRYKIICVDGNGEFKSMKNYEQ